MTESKFGVLTVVVAIAFLNKINGLYRARCGKHAVLGSQVGPRRDARSVNNFLPWGSSILAFSPQSANMLSAIRNKCDSSPMPNCVGSTL